MSGALCPPSRPGPVLCLSAATKTGTFPSSTSKKEGKKVPNLPKRTLCRPVQSSDEAQIRGNSNDFSCAADSSKGTPCVLQEQLRA